MTPLEFQRRYKELYMPLGMYALRIVEDVLVAEDVVQTAFEAAWQHVAEITDIKPYMYRAVRHEALRQAQRMKAMDVVPESYCEEVTESDVDTSERDAALWQAISDLPERCREVFLMAKRDGMSHAEIADELGISVKTVENQITKAYTRLRGDSKIRALRGNFSILLFIV